MPVHHSAHPLARHLDEPPADEIVVISGPVDGVVTLFYALGEGVWLSEGCEVLASTGRGEMFVRYRCSDDDRLYEGWVRMDALTLMGRFGADPAEPLDGGHRAVANMP